MILNFSLLRVSKLKTHELTENYENILSHQFLLQLVQVLSAYLTKDNDKVNLVCSGQPDNESCFRKLKTREENGSMSGQYLEFQHSTNSILFMQPKLIHVDLNVLVLVLLHEGCARLPNTGTMQCYYCQNPYFCLGGSVTFTRSVHEHLTDM